MSEKEIVYIIPEVTSLTKLEKERKLKVTLPRLKDVVNKLRKELSEAGIEEYSATIEAYITIGTGEHIPGGELGFTASVTFTGKPNLKN